MSLDLNQVFSVLERAELTGYSVKNNSSYNLNFVKIACGHQACGINMQHSSWLDKVMMAKAYMIYRSLNTVTVHSIIVG